MVRLIRSTDLTIGSGMVGNGEAMLHVVRFADHVEADLMRPGGVPVAGLLGEVDAIVGQDRVDAERHGFQEMLEELTGRPPVSVVDQLDGRKFPGAVDIGSGEELIAAT
ncbi:hypothetical protein FHT02_004151 [Sphingomonas xinjiangensis]|uniref:Uncharacterized protein n=1 Tax=Sphingomonas xinjiangensis TaxID=643568 RepID=A0A840YT94_9SPHN|nr:hypothetical protein [Sphingomonas xinjiangensis]